MYEGNARWSIQHFWCNRGKGGSGFSGIFAEQEMDWNAVATLVIVRVPASKTRREENLLEWAAGISTEGAQEMQKAWG
jgi:hypothetical protein